MSANHENPASFSTARPTLFGRLVAWLHRNVEFVEWSEDDDTVGDPLGSPYANGNSSPGAIMAARSGRDH
jgi:hypothetical protein